MNRYPTLLGAGLVTLGLTTAAGANPSNEAEPVTLPPLQVRADGAAQLNLKQPAGGSRLALSPLETPASIEVIDGATIRRRGDSALIDAITRAVGIATAAAPGNGGSAVSARGFSGHGSVSQLFDGSRLYVGAGSVTFPFDSWSAQRVEVLHGPASVLYGEGSIGGAINIVPKKPSREASYEGRIAGGSDDLRRLAFGATGPLGEALAYRFDISHNAGNGWVDNGDFESLAVAGAVRWDMTDTVAVTLSHDDGRQQPMRYFGVPLRDGRLDSRLEERNFNVEDAVLDYHDRWTRLHIGWTPSEGLSLTNELYRLASDRHWRNAENYAYTAGGLVRRSSFLEILHEQEQVGNRFNVAISGRPFGLENDFSAGFDINEIDFTHINNSPYTEDPLSPSLVDPLAPAPGYFVNLVGTTPRYRTQTRQHALFFENRLRVADKLALVAGARYDSAELERDDLLNPVAGFDKNFYNSSWRLGAVLDIAPDTVIYGQYGTGADHLGSLITTSASQVDFDLSTGEQWEVGLKQSLAGGRGQWTLAWYDIVKEKLLSRDPDDPAITRQIGQRSARGLEAAIAFELGGGWRIDANVAALRARYDDYKAQSGGVLIAYDGNVPSGVPERTANLWLTWAIDQRWEASAGARYVGKRYSNDANSESVDAYTVFDAALRWQANSNIAVSLHGFNLTDELYSTTSNSTRWLLARPRSFELAVDFLY